MIPLPPKNTNAPRLAARGATKPPAKRSQGASSSAKATRPYSPGASQAARIRSTPESRATVAQLKTALSQDDGLGKFAERLAARPAGEAPQAPTAAQWAEVLSDNRAAAAAVQKTLPGYSKLRDQAALEKKDPKALDGTAQQALADKWNALPAEALLGALVDDYSKTAPGAQRAKSIDAIVKDLGLSNAVSPADREQLDKALKDGFGGVADTLESLDKNRSKLGKGELAYELIKATNANMRAYAALKP